MKNASDVKWEVYDLIQNIGSSVLLGVFTDEIFVKLEDGKQIKIEFKEVTK